ncbi:SDR family NAD(P)-dependent oxidoreductase [Rubripirellula reticaptiva]|nr:SDR family NAD(P)-dependent oxidoreductase [Rubripirellula reticaptiva]
MPTTLVTGASSGIGWELAKRFAKGGDGLVLVARSEDKLYELADQVRQKHGVNAIVIPKDLARPDAIDERCRQLRERSIQVDTLVNNAGQGRVRRLCQQQGHRHSQLEEPSDDDIDKLSATLRNPKIGRQAAWGLTAHGRLKLQACRLFP